MLSDITPLILTYNEEENIDRCLRGVAWAKRIVVVDSFSTDKTLEICRSFPQVDVRQRKFDAHGQQWNFGLHETDITTPWVLALDSDYMVNEAAAAEIAALQPPPSILGYRATFDYCVGGRRLRCGVYPPVVVLFRRERSRYVQDGHTQRIAVEGDVLELKTRLQHDDRKPLARWITSQTAYAQLETERMLNSSRGLRDVFRTRLPISWMLIPTYILIFRGGLFDGWRGWIYALERAIAEALISLAYLKRTRSPSHDGQPR